MAWGDKGDSMSSGAAILDAYAQAAKLSVLETIWPSRCIICEVAGELVCDKCRSSLSFIDQWEACPCCGAPHGLRQCSECNELRLGEAGRSELPFESCVSSVVFDEASARIVRCFKDQGERGLADFMAYCMACSVPCGWLDGQSHVVPIPATRKAVNRRGFDHIAEVSMALAAYLDLPYHEVLAVENPKDQRSLSRRERIGNMAKRFRVIDSCSGLDILLVDDVYTTGSTLYAATDALLAAGARSIRCVTFSRVY